jgi:hypothetical protein
LDGRRQEQARRAPRAERRAAGPAARGDPAEPVPLRSRARRRLEAPQRDHPGQGEIARIKTILRLRELDRLGRAAAATPPPPTSPRTR